MPDFEMSSDWQEQVIAAILPAQEERKDRIEADARNYCPVETGRLRDSIHGEVDASTGDITVGAAADYAEYVELGTSEQPAQPFLRPALYRNVGSAE